METLMKLLGEAETVAILGHVHPDGDCVGSCLACIIIWPTTLGSSPSGSF